MSEGFGAAWKRHLVGLLVMPVGATVVLGSVVVMNELSAPPEKTDVGKVTQIEVAKAPKPKPKKKTKKPKPKPKPKSRTPPPPSLAALTSGLGSISVDVPGLQMEDMGGAAGDLLGGGGDVVHTSDTVDDQPEVQRRAPIQFPPSVRKKGVEGYVLLNLLIGKTGEVQDARVLESQPPGVFDQAALDGVRGWSFAPGRYKGEAVQTWVQQRIAFRLENR